jgi:Type II secretory pathway, pseudopilin PulG
MKKKSAFTLLELLISIAISAFIITAMMQSIRNAQKTLSRSRAILQVNKTVCILFNQIERDFNTALSPQLSSKETTTQDSADGKKTEPKKDEAAETKKEPEAAETKDKKKKEETNFFIGETAEGESKLIDGKSYSLFKSVSFVNTNPFQVWGEKRVRLVRIGYELVPIKNKSSRDITLYDLFRKETSDLTNEKFKENKEPTPGKEQADIKKYLVASNIKEMYLEYQMKKPQDKTKQTHLTPTAEQPEEELIKSFAWGNTEETQNKEPQQVALRITFGSSDVYGEKTYQCIIPIFPVQITKEKKPKPEVDAPVKPEGPPIPKEKVR